MDGMIDRRRDSKPDPRRVAEIAARAKQMEHLDPAPPSEEARREVEEERSEAHRVWIRRGCAWENLNAAERSLLGRYPEAMDDDPWPADEEQAKVERVEAPSEPPFVGGGGEHRPRLTDEEWRWVRERRRARASGREEGDDAP